MAVSNTALRTVFGVMEMVLFSGVIYGWANMVLILKDEEYFKDLCEPENSTIIKPTTDTEDDDECAGQDDRLALVFTIAVFSFNAAGFLGGVLFDHLGTRLTRLIACGFFFIAGLLAFFMEKDTANLIFPVLACLAIAGMLLAISLFQIAQLHPKHKLAVSSSLSGALDSSSVVFLIFKVCYDSGASFRWILIIYVIIAILCVVANSFVFLPKMSISLDQTKSSNNTELQSLDAEIEMHECEGDRPRESTTTNSSDIQVESKFSNGWRYILTSNYIWLFYYFAFVQLRLWFFVGSLNPFLTFRTDNDNDKVDSYSRSFGIVQFFGFVFAPFTGIVMDLKPKSIRNPYFGPILSFIITNLLCLLLGVLVLVPVLEVQYLSFVVQVAMRAFLYASLISFILRAFPVIHYGKLYGVCTLAGAVVSLLQYPAFIILEGPFDGDPFWVNFVFLTLSFTGFGFPLYLWISNRKNENVTAHVDAIEEPESNARLINLQNRSL